MPLTERSRARETASPTDADEPSTTEDFDDIPPVKEASFPTDTVLVHVTDSTAENDDPTHRSPETDES